MVWRLAAMLTSVLALQTFSSRALGVRVDVLVMEGGKPVAGLVARDFAVRDNGVLQRVEVVDSTDVPINVVLALDTSASVAGRARGDLVRAGEGILDGLRPADRAALTTFSHAVTPATQLTADLATVRAELRDVQPHGRTSVMDGVYVALTSTLDHASRFLLVVCTDGADTMSWLKPSEVLDAAKRANAVVYAVTSSDGRQSEPLKQPDTAVHYISGLTYRGRAELNVSYAWFVRVLREELITTRTPIEQNVTAFARIIRREPGTSIFLKRAAILHADALIFARRFPAPADDAPAPPPQRSSSDAPLVASPPLLHNQWMTLTRDGEVLGSVKADWNLPFARSLLDVLLLPITTVPTAIDCPPNLGVRCTPVTVVDRRVSPEDREFVAEWYHAVSAFLFANGKHADATTHLQQAAHVLPDDPRAVFDRATYAEVFGLPIYQTVRADSSYNRRNGIVANIPAEDKTNAEAENLYRRVLRIDPTYVEARVRLARLLERRGRVDEAASEIAAALAASPSGVTRFYALIVAGRIASARERYTDALQHYRAATALYRQAQSALLGASHAALMLADVPQTLTPLADLEGSAATATADPWWDYELGAGRDAGNLLDAMRARVTK